MGSYVVKVPDVGEGVAEVELVSWAVQPGDSVAKHQVLAEVMTDKANVEIPAPAAGVVERLTGDAGDVLAVGSDLIALTIDGGDPPVEPPNTRLATDSATAQPPRPPVEPAAAIVDQSERAEVPVPEEAAEANVPPSPPARPPGAARPAAAPAVRARAKALGIDLYDVAGSGPGGRIVHEDLDLVSQPKPGRPAPNEQRTAPTGRGPSAAPSNVEPLIGLRRKIAERMVTATTTIPHITYVDEIDMTALWSLRTELNAGAPPDTPKLSILPFLIRAVTSSVSVAPYLNAHVDDAAGEIRTFDQVDVGIATQTPRGLVVAVLRAAQHRSIWELGARLAELAQSAKDGSIPAEDLSGSTITISSLGELGGIVSTPIINKPETSIVGVNKLVTRPVWIDGQFVPRQMMNLSSSFDHRVIDGYDAARFITEVKRKLEQPALLFIYDA